MTAKASLLRHSRHFLEFYRENTGKSTNKPKYKIVEKLMLNDKMKQRLIYKLKVGLQTALYMLI